MAESPRAPAYDEERAVDFNQLYFDHQALLMKAGRAPTPSGRRALEVAASLVAGRIGCLQRAVGASAARTWEVHAVSDDSSLALLKCHLHGYAH